MRKGIIAAIALATLAAILVGQANVGYTQGDAGLRVGVVNVKEVFSNYTVAKQFEAEVEKEKTSAQEEINGIEKEMKDLMAEIQILEPNSALRLEKEETLLQKDTLRKFKSERWKAITLKRINENTAKIYNAIRAEVDAYAAEQGYTLVFKVETPRLEEKSEESANKRVNMRNVLYFSPTMDLTAMITQRLNAK